MHSFSKAKCFTTCRSLICFLVDIFQFVVLKDAYLLNPWYCSTLLKNICGFAICNLQEDGEKKIELKPGYMMEHDENVHILFVYVSKPSEILKDVLMKHYYMITLIYVPQRIVLITLALIYCNFLGRLELLLLDLIVTSTITKFSTLIILIFLS